jgi:acetamidase/formamidase
MEHCFEISTNHLHDHYAADIPPALVIESGDVVTMQTLDVGWGLRLPEDRDAPLPTYAKPAAATNGGPPLCGPIFVKGSQPGDVLEVHIEEVIPGTWGWTRCGERDIWIERELKVSGEHRQLFKWSIDAAAGIARSNFGHQINISPFMGMMGVCPPGKGVHDPWTPSAYGGNLDCKMLTRGSILYLPIAIPGALFSTGDGHAVQGDGELCGSAMECGMESVRMKFVVNRTMKISRLRAWTADAWVTFGFAESLNDALIEAANDMLDHIRDSYRCTQRADALALASYAVDFHVTQVANPKFGIHAVLPHGLIKQ